MKRCIMGYMKFPPFSCSKLRYLSNSNLISRSLYTRFSNSTTAVKSSARILLNMRLKITVNGSDRCNSTPAILPAARSHRKSEIRPTRFQEDKKSTNVMRISLFIVINTKLKTRYPCMYRFQINLFMVIRSHYTFKCMRCGKKLPWKC